MSLENQSGGFSFSGVVFFDRSKFPTASSLTTSLFSFAQFFTQKRIFYSFFEGRGILVISAKMLHTI